MTEQDLPPIYAAARHMLQVAAEAQLTNVAGFRGSECVNLTRCGADYALTLSDTQPICQETMKAWADAIGRPGIEWLTAYGQTVARCEWRGDGEDLPAPPFVWIGRDRS